MILKIHFECHFERLQEKKATETSSSTEAAAAATTAASMPTNDCKNQRKFKGKKLYVDFLFYLRLQNQPNDFEREERSGLVELEKKLPQFHKEYTK